MSSAFTKGRGQKYLSVQHCSLGAHNYPYTLVASPAPASLPSRSVGGASLCCRWTGGRWGPVSGGQGSVLPRQLQNPAARSYKMLRCPQTIFLTISLMRVISFDKIHLYQDNSCSGNLTGLIFNKFFFSNFIIIQKIFIYYMFKYFKYICFDCKLWVCP